MRGLVDIPQTRDLARAYQRLQAAAPLPTPEELALWSEWSRFDPRLAEQMVTHLARCWRTINPVELNTRLRILPWPAAMGVLLEQAHRIFGISKADTRLFRGWKNCVMAGIRPAHGEQYFIGLRSFAGKAMREDAIYSLNVYKRWGYLGREILLNKAARTQIKTLLPAQTRRAVLDELIAGRTRLTVKDYREALGACVSIRQAELDLRAHPRLRARGNTKGRFYIVERGGRR